MRTSPVHGRANDLRLDDAETSGICRALGRDRNAGVAVPVEITVGSSFNEEPREMLKKFTLVSYYVVDDINNEIGKNGKTGERLS